MVGNVLCSVVLRPLWKGHLWPGVQVGTRLELRKTEFSIPSKPHPPQLPGERNENLWNSCSMDSLAWYCSWGRAEAWAREEPIRQPWVFAKGKALLHGWSAALIYSVCLSPCLSWQRHQQESREEWHVTRQRDSACIAGSRASFWQVSVVASGRGVIFVTTDGMKWLLQFTSILKHCF